LNLEENNGGRKTQLAIETTCCRDVKDLGLSQNQAYRKIASLGQMMIIHWISGSPT